MESNPGYPLKSFLLYLHFCYVIHIFSTLQYHFNTLQDAGEEGNHRIWEKDFADLLLTYADYSPKKRSAVLKRVKKRHSIYVRTVSS